MCGTALCPFEAFKDIALTITGSDCLEEPLKSTVASMMKADDTGAGSGGSDNGGVEDIKVVLVTVAVCAAVAAVAAVAYQRFRSQRDSGRVRLRMIANSDSTTAAAGTAGTAGAGGYGTVDAKSDHNAI